MPWPHMGWGIDRLHPRGGACSTAPGAGMHRSAAKKGHLDHGATAQIEMPPGETVRGRRSLGFLCKTAVAQKIHELLGKDEIVFGEREAGPVLIDMAKGETHLPHRRRFA